MPDIVIGAVIGSAIEMITGLNGDVSGIAIGETEIKTSKDVGIATLNDLVTNVLEGTNCLLNGRTPMTRVHGVSIVMENHVQEGSIYYIR